MLSKDNVAEEVAAKLNLPKGQTRDIVNAVFDVIGSSLKQSQEVRIHGFGTFNVKDTPARVGRNPSTGEPVDIAAGRKVTFKPTSDLKKSV